MQANDTTNANANANANANSTPTTLTAALAKAQDSIRATQSVFVERDSVLMGLWTCLIAREHCLLLGPPGTGKSAVVNAVVGTLDGATKFSWLLTKFSTPEELFGPISLKGLEQDDYRRIVDGKLPVADVAFLDEIFKANSAILNSLLTVVNERAYDNGRVRLQCPLQTMVGASNELPGREAGQTDGGASESLGALYDRFAMRFWVAPIADQDALLSLLLSTPGDPQVAEKVTMDDLATLQQAALTLPVPVGVAQLLLLVKADLEAEGVKRSDRTWRKLVQLLRARAVLDGCEQVQEDHLEVLVDCLWNAPSERAVVARVVGKRANPLVAEATKLVDLATEIMKRFPEPAQVLAQIAKVATINRELEQVVTQGEQLLAGQPAHRVGKLLDAVNAVRAMQQEAVRRTAQATGVSAPRR